ncbi:Predicted PurR-regulated permease PerM [Haloplanus vescus]|uniref:Predicted PurR-regulated permease PerM n=1 Tax=Haloplanus vescus TaxID=555874 RepID=A0A1H3VVR9_9EURY|nr:AI-2E family transporter [Haloplanus vescus]SDZ78897.1 Predicted PurR-regulated permease PerM [Haloplanus vescus]
MIDEMDFERSRTLWWALTVALGGTLGVVLYSYVGTFVFGLFIYYAARPVYRRLRLVVERPGLAAAGALFAFELPFLAVTGYLLFLAVRELERYAGAGAQVVAWVLPIPTTELERAIDSPRTYVSSFDVASLTEVISTGGDVLGPIATFVLHFSLAIALAFYLLRDGDRIANWFHDEVGHDSALSTYASLVDRDFQVVCFGNIRTVVVVALLALGVYNGLNVLAPPGLKIPIPNVLALLTGVATLVPIVVGKIVYIPTTAYLAVVAIESDPQTLWFPIVVAVVALLVLDLFPIMVVRPAFAGQSTHRGAMMFSYIFGGLLFNWYGVFLGPLLLIATIHLVRVGLSELAHGDHITAEITTAHGLGSMPRPDGDPPDETTGDTDTAAE